MLRSVPVSGATGPMAELQAGDVLGGVRIDDVTGRGGMGIVYRGTELALKRTVAIKLVRGDLAENAEFRARFTRESEIAASLDHAHVIPIFAAGEDQGRLYVTMRYVDGTDLRERIKAVGGLDPIFAATVVSQIASALDAAHRRGLVHRDVKPANILLADADGQPHAYLTDFGVSRGPESDGLTQAGAMVGTDDYMAPEQFENKAVDGRADIYSLGCVLYETLTGHVPFERDSMAAKLYAHLRQPPPPLPGHLPQALNRVIGRAMAKNVDERYATAGEMGRDLLAAVSQPGDSVAGLTTDLFTVPQHGRQRWVGPDGIETLPRTVPPYGQGPPSHPGGQPPGSYGFSAGPGGPYPYASGPMPQSYRTNINPGPAKRSKAVLIGALVAVVVVVAGSVGAWLLLRDDGSTPAASTEPPKPLTFGTLDGDPIKVGAEPNDIIEAGGFMWTANSGDGTVTKIDPKTGDTQQFQVDGSPEQLAATPGAVWVQNKPNTVTRIDIDSGDVSPPISPGPRYDINGIAGGAGDLWVSHVNDNTVTRIDANSRTIVGSPIPVGQVPGQLVVGDLYTFVVNNGDKTISVISRDGLVLQTLKPPGNPSGIEIVDGTMWVLTGEDAVPIDERTFIVGDPVPIKGASSASAGDDGIFAAFPVSNELSWFDVKGKESKGTAIAGTGRGVVELCFVDGTLWVLDGATREVLRVKVA